MSEQTTAIINIGPNHDPEYIGLLLEVNSLLDYAKGRIVSVPEDARSATDDLALMAKFRKTVEDLRKTYTGPLNGFVKEINGKFALLSDPLAEAEKLTKSKVLAWQAEEDRKRREAEEINRLRREAAEREAALHDTPVVEPEPIAVIEAPRKIQTDMGSTGTSTIWKYEVTDFNALPDEYKTVDSVKLGKVVRAGLHQIPGCRIWGEPNLRVTAR